MTQDVLYRTYKDVYCPFVNRPLLKAWVGDRIPVGGEIFRTRPHRPWAHPASYTVGTESFPGVKQPGRGIDHPPYLAQRLKKE